MRRTELEKLVLYLRYIWTDNASEPGERLDLMRVLRQKTTGFFINSLQDWMYDRLSRNRRRNPAIIRTTDARFLVYVLQRVEEQWIDGPADVEDIWATAVSMTELVNQQIRRRQDPRKTCHCRDLDDQQRKWARHFCLACFRSFQCVDMMSGPLDWRVCRRCHQLWLAILMDENTG